MARAAATESTGAFRRCLGDALNRHESELFRLIDTKDAIAIENHIKFYWKNIDFKKKGARGYTLLEEAVLSKMDWLCELLTGIEQGIPIADALILASKTKTPHILNFLLGSLHKTSSTSPPVSKTNPVEQEHETFSDSAETSFDTPESQSPIPEEQIVLPPNNGDDSECAIRNKGKKPPKVNESGRTWQLSKKSSRDSPMKMEKIAQAFPLPVYNPIDVLRRGAIMEDVDIVQSLVNAGIRLPETCPSFSHSSGDSVKDFAIQLDMFKARSSPVYIAFSERDPMLAAFQRNNEMLTLSAKFPEYKSELKHLALKCEQFAVDLLHLCRSSPEVCTLLKLSSGITTPFAEVQYGRLQLALHYTQKKFIAHPKCQNVVNSLWTKGLSHWRHWNSLRKAQHVLTQTLFMPFIITMAIFDCSSTCASVAAVPLNRFLYSVTSYTSFLILMTAILLNGSPITPWMSSLALFFVTSSLLRLFITDLPMEGVSNFIRNFWNIYDAILYLLLFIAFVCIVVDQNRLTPCDQVLAVGESVLAVASILAYSRILCWFHMSSTLGPFIIAFRRILLVVYHVLAVFSILFVAFSFSLFFLYSRKVDNVKDDNDEDGKSFSKLSDSFSLLFWALYGHGEDTYSFNDKESSNSSSIEQPSSTRNLALLEMTGTFIWGFFHVAFVIILLNMLIAMMTNTFERIHADCDTEWKFARTKMQMYYFERCTAIPEPFNILHYGMAFPSWLWKFAKAKLMKGRSESSNVCSRRINIDLQSEKENSFDQHDYSELVNGLITEYFRQKMSTK